MDSIIGIIKSGLRYLLFAVTAFLSLEAKGQEFVPPSGVINPFITQDSTEAAIAYNNLNSKTRAERDGLVDARIKASRVHTIPPNDDPVFNCNNWCQLQIVNAYDLGESVFDFQWNKLLYNGCVNRYLCKWRNIG
jgi:hypothetical protein